MWVERSTLSVLFLESIRGATCPHILVHKSEAFWRIKDVVSHHSSPHLSLSFQGKRLPAYLSADAEEGEVSDDDSADEIEDDFKLKSSNVSVARNILCVQKCVLKKKNRLLVCGFLWNEIYALKTSYSTA